MALVKAKSFKNLEAEKRALEAKLSTLGLKLETAFKEKARSHAYVDAAIVIDIIDVLKIDVGMRSRMLSYCRTGKRSNDAKTRREYIKVSEHLKKN